MLRGSLSRALERGALRGPASRGLSALWREVADPVRPVALPRGVRVVGVGGATLGGSGKTPLVLALARELSRTRQVTVVASAYSARVRGPRAVELGDCATRVGDEAAWLARALHPLRVVVGRDRSAALALAARHAELVIVDGLLQARPERLGCALLCLDGAAPWGAGRCPPAGDLRARVPKLLDAADAVVAVGPPLELGPAAPPLHRVETALAGARDADGRFVGLETIRAARVGLVLAIARPERVLAELRRHGIEPFAIELHADHASIPAPGPARVEAWLTTPKCATKLGRSRGAAPVWALEQRVTLPSELIELAGGLAASPPAQVRARLQTVFRAPKGAPR